MALALQTGKAQNSREIIIERPDGCRVVALAHAHPFLDEQGAVIGAANVLVDITDRKRAEETQRALNGQLTTELEAAQRLQRISTQLIGADDADSLNHQLLDAAVSIMNADMGNMRLFHPEQSELQLLAWKGLDPEGAAFWEWIGLDSGSASGEALRLGKRVLVPNIEACPFMAGTSDLDAYRQAGIRAVQSTPLFSRSGRMLGMLSTHWRQPHQPRERELRLLDVLARQAADLIERKQNEEALREVDRRKDEFLAMLSHELRNPLATICSVAQTLRLDLDDPSLWQEALDALDRQVKMTTRLIDDLLDISRITSGRIQLQRADEDLIQIVQRAVAGVHSDIKECQQEMTVSLPEEAI